MSSKPYNCPACGIVSESFDDEHAPACPEVEDHFKHMAYMAEKTGVFNGGCSCRHCFHRLGIKEPTLEFFYTVGENDFRPSPEHELKPLEPPYESLKARAGEATRDEVFKITVKSRTARSSVVIHPIAITDVPTRLAHALEVLEKRVRNRLLSNAAPPAPRPGEPIAEPGGST